MDMTLRWFGTGYDSVTLQQIRQIPGVSGVVTTLYNTQPGEAWEEAQIESIRKEVESHGLAIKGIESVNIHESIKAGLPDRDQYIQNYITTLERLGRQGITMVCYNFMPVFDWTRSDLAKPREDGSTVLSYDQSIIDQIDPEAIFESIDQKSNGFVLPGWEPERLARIMELFELYRSVDSEQLFANLQYFLNAIMPVCEQYGIRMAIHPDDPAWPVFNLPRIMGDKQNLLRLVGLVNSPCNGVTLCTGSLASNPDNNIPEIIHALKGHIHFAHVRNVRHLAPGKFDEAAHLSSDGSLDMFAILKAFYDSGFDGVIRPDHGRAIWGEVAMPGYGLYDRALGATYLNGLWEAISKMSK